MYLSPLFTPLSLFYADAVRFRRFLYRVGVFKQTRLPVPVIIVGNITVGGTGKTPLVIKLAELLILHGYKPGIVSRGYAGADYHQPRAVFADSDARQVGDEAVLLAGRCACPVFIGKRRVDAARLLLEQHDCDVIIADDGLQHYALQRDIEIVVIDGERRFGNGYCLPAGPLREPPARLTEADFVVVNGGDPQPGELPMDCRGEELVNLSTGVRQPLSAWDGAACHAVAAIGNPERFFKQLAAAGLRCEAHAFPDHYPYTLKDIQFNDERPVIMTEKDAVKCRRLADPRHWYLPVTAEIAEAFSQQLLTLLAEKIHGYKIA
jgi:tetraacyldisaccharide 4'-kinase